MKVVVLGGGGHAFVVIEALLCANVEVIGFTSRRDDYADILGVPLLGDDDALIKLKHDGVEHFAVGMGSVGDTFLRRKLAETGLSAGLKPFTVVHTKAIIARGVELGQGVQVMAGAIINPSSSIGDFSIINTGAIVEHHCSVGAFSHVSPSSTLLGNCQVGSDSHIGASATVLQGLHVGDNVMIGAGAVVISDVPSGFKVVGVPAKAPRNSTP